MADENSWFYKQWGADAGQQLGLLGAEGAPAPKEQTQELPKQKEKSPKDKFKPAPTPSNVEDWMKDPAMAASMGMDEQGWARLNAGQLAQIDAAKNQPKYIAPPTAPPTEQQPQTPPDKIDLSREQIAQIMAATKAIKAPQPNPKDIGQAVPLKASPAPTPTPQAQEQMAQTEGQNTPEPPKMVEDQTQFPQPDSSGLPETGLGLYGNETQSTNPVTSSGRVNDLYTGQLANEIAPSRWEKFITNLQLASESSPVGFMPDETGAWMRGMAQNELEAQNAARGIFKISAEEANKRFPGMPVPFSEDVDPYVAQLQYEDFLHRTRLQAWAARGEASPFSDFGAGMAAGFADPLNAALGLATFGEAGLFKALGLAEGFTAAGVRNVFLGNLGINTATGIPTYLQEKRERQDVNLMDEAHSAMVGAIGGTGLHYFMHGIGYLFKRPVEPANVTEDNVKSRVAAEETRTKAEYTPNPTDIPGAGGAAGEFGERGMGRSYGAEQLPRNIHFVGIRSDGSFVLHDDNLGPGIQTSNNQGRVNAMASDGTGHGYVAKLKMPEDLNLLDLNKAADAAESKPVVDEIRKELGIDKTKEVVEAGKGDASVLEPKAGESIKDYLDRLHKLVTDPAAWNDALSALSDTFRKEGYAGYGYDSAGEQRTHLFYLDNLLAHSDGPRLGPPQLADQRITPESQTSVDEKAVPLISQEAKQKMIEDAMKPENSQDANMDAEVRELKKGPSINSKPEDMDEPTQNMAQQAQATLDRLAKEDPELHAEIQEELKRIKEEGATNKQTEQALKDFADCVGENMV